MAVNDGEDVRYVRRARSDTWHWIKACANYPPASEHAVTVTQAFPKRPRGDLCNECKAKERGEVIPVTKNSRVL